MASCLALQVTCAIAEDERETAGSWEIAKSKSMIDDSDIIIAAAIRANATGSEPVGLFIRCKEKKTELFVTTNGFWGLTVRDGFRVIYRINKDKAIDGTWSSSDSGRAVFYPKSPISFIKSLPEDGMLAMRVFSYNGTPSEGLFTLSGIDIVRNQVASACSWPASK
jgi:type VI secretion system protein VasI